MLHFGLMLHFAVKVVTCVDCHILRRNIRLVNSLFSQAKLDPPDKRPVYLLLWGKGYLQWKNIFLRSHMSPIYSPSLLYGPASFPGSPGTGRRKSMGTTLAVNRCEASYLVPPGQTFIWKPPPRQCHHGAPMVPIFHYSLRLLGSCAAQ